MMKKRTIQRITMCFAAALLLFMCAGAQAQTYDAQMAGSWLAQFAQALSASVPLNDPVLTADPARAGQYLIEYEFGTVLSAVPAHPDEQDILEIDVRSSQVTDCRGVRVGMPVEQVLDGGQPVYGTSPLYVLSTQEAGYGWSWAYVGEDGVYGVEYIAYAEEASAMKEYTLTYVIDGGVVTAIRMKVADATLAQAQDGLETAEEIASRQDAGALIQANDRRAVALEDLKIMGRTGLGVPVDQLIAVMGEPADVQTLPQSAGRVLVYNGAVVTLGFNELTGEEIVRAVSVSSDALEGPNRLAVGMTLREAGGLFRCDWDMYSRGGLLYLEGEALGEAPYGELKAIGSREMQLMYACEAENDTAVLQAIAMDGEIVSWQLMYMSDTEGGV